MSSNRKLSRYTDGHGVAPDHAGPAADPDPNPGREPAGVDPDAELVEDDTECVECG